MDKKIKLSKRLAAVAGLIPYGNGVVDVGTDHGYIPVYLAQNGYPGKITASDIRKGPLESAMSSAREYGAADRISFRLADGLAGAEQDGADAVVIAGMGGETIAKILEKAPWTKNGVELILQPQSKIDVLADWLCGNGYYIKNAVLCRDDGRIYLALRASGGAGERPGPFCLNLLIKSADPLWGEYLQGIISKEEAALRGMKMSKDAGAEAEKTEAVLRELIKIGEENGLWRL